MALTSPAVKEEFLPQHEDSVGVVTTEVSVIEATDNDPVSSLICSGLETINGTFSIGTDDCDKIEGNRSQLNSALIVSSKVYITELCLVYFFNLSTYA